MRQSPHPPSLHSDPEQIDPMGPGATQDNLPVPDRRLRSHASRQGTATQSNITMSTHDEQPEPDMTQITTMLKSLQQEVAALKQENAELRAQQSVAPTPDVASTDRELAPENTP